MNKHIGQSLLLAAIVAVGLGSSARAGDFNGTEEDLAVPQGSFLSTAAFPVHSENVSPIAKAENGESRPVAILRGTEEDLAVPQGAFTSTMTLPNAREDKARESKVRVAKASAGKHVATGVE